MTEPTKMDKDLHLKLVEAWWDGNVEFKDGETWIPAAFAPCERSYVGDYRIRPKPTLRPWKPEEVPVGAVLKYTDQANRWMITGSGGNGIYTGGALQPLQPGFVLEKCVHSLDGGKTWLPCGTITTEESQ